MLNNQWIKKSSSFAYKEETLLFVLFTTALETLRVSPQSSNTCPDTFLQHQVEQMHRIQKYQVRGSQLIFGHILPFAFSLTINHNYALSFIHLYSR